MKKNSPVIFSLVKKTLAASIAILSTSAFALSPPANTFWSVQNGQLLDTTGKPFIFRGVTIDHTLAPERTVQALKDIAALGANSAQIEFTLKDYSVFPRPIVTQIQQIVETCVAQKLVCVLEPNDVAGFGSHPTSTSPSGTISYWSDIYYVLRGAEKNVIIGLGNQHFDGTEGAEIIYRSGIPTYASSLLSALPTGFVVMVDGNVWSQDTDKAMQNIARTINEDVVLRSKVIYSVDFFDQYVNPELIREYIETFNEIGAPLVIGGFGPVPYYHPHFPGPLPLYAPRLPAEAVMQYAQQYGAGYFGWSWSGNKNPALDVVIDWNPDHLTSWGNILFNDVNGIKATAKPASFYVNSSSSSAVSSSSAPANRPPVAMFEVYNSYSGSCTNGRITATATGTYDPDGDDLTYSWNLSENGGNAQQATGFSASFISRSGSRYQMILTVTDSKGASVSLTKSVSPIYIDCVSSASSSSRSSSSVRSSSSSVDIISSRSSSSSSIRSSSVSSSARSSSSAISGGNCSYVINSQWNNGFTAAIRIKNTGAQPINSWNVNWQYADGSKVTNLWNASLTGSNPYSAKNLSWNSTIQPGQTVEFGFQGSKPNGVATIPAVAGSVCR